MKSLTRSPHRSGGTEEHWIPLSDLMTGLMMIFMLVAVLFMVQVQAAERKMSDVAEKYLEMKNNLYEDLLREFKDDLPRWHAQLDRDLTIRFEEPDVLFDVGKAVLKPQFAAILSDFFPRYIRIIDSDKYRNSIEEIRIEGHTSTIWSGLQSSDEAYFRNMDLSQSRTRSALEYVLLLPKVAADKPWLIAHLTANGLSSSHIIRNPDGTENPGASQRVEFRVRTNADARIGEILAAGQ